MRIDNNSSSSVCTHPLKHAQRAEQQGIQKLAVEPPRDSYQVVSPERVRGPRLEDLEPRFCAPPPSSSTPTGAGYSQHAGGGKTVETQKACLEHMEQLHGHLSSIKQQYGEWKAANPNAPEPTDGEKTMGEILELPVHEQCVRILCIVIHERPQVLEDAAVHASPEPSFGIPGNEIPNQQPPAAQQPAAGGDFMSQMGQLFGPLAQMLGGFLSSPLAQPLLMAAANLIPPPVGQIVAVAIPFIAPIAGQMLSGMGGSMGGAAGAPGAAPDLSALIGGVGGLLGGAGAVAGTPAPLPAAV